MNMVEKLDFYSKLSKFVSSMKIMLLLFGILLSLSGCERISDPVLPDDSTLEAEPLTMMTYNVYVGANMEGLIGITNLLEVPAAVADVYAEAIASDFPGRAAGIAALIKTHRPHIIGLQEISLIRRQAEPGRPGSQAENLLKRSSWIFLKF